MTEKTFRVLVSDKLAPEGVEIFKSHAPRIQVDVRVGLSNDELLQIIPEYHGLAVRSATKATAEVIEAGKNLKVIGRAGIGVDNVDVEAATRRGILVMNTPSGNTVTTAEHAIALMVALARKIPQATASMRAGKWEKTKFEGSELFQKTIGVIGLGNIGKIAANRAKGLGMKVIAFDPFVTKEQAMELGVTWVALDELLTRSDFITLHVPLLESTRNIIDQAALNKMKKGAFLINAARGGLVDEKAVAEALRSGKLAGAAFDVFEQEPPPADHPLLSLDNAIVTPHLGASTSEAQVNVAIQVAEQISEYLLAGGVSNAVNAPTVSAELQGAIGGFVALGEHMGGFAGQLHKGGIREMRMTYAGSIAEQPTAPVTSAALTGVLRVAMGDEVNAVSSRYLARERDIEIVEQASTKARYFTHSITLRLTGDQGTTELVGAIFDTEPRIVGVNGFHLEILPKGTVLLTSHKDKPGIIGRIGTVLGSHGVNISRLHLDKRGDTGGLAQSAIAIDGVASKEALDALGALDGIEWVKQVRLGSTTVA
jgi:D-3-phosphoglycerate dehydrogenase / 2-oxoglutarate reductase